MSASTTDGGGQPSSSAPGIHGDEIVRYAVMSEAEDLHMGGDHVKQTPDGRTASWARWGCRGIGFPSVADPLLMCATASPHAVYGRRFRRPLGVAGGGLLIYALAGVW